MKGFKGQTTDLANKVVQTTDTYPQPETQGPTQAPSPVPSAPTPAVGPIRRSNHVRNTVNGRYLKGDRRA